MSKLDEKRLDEMEPKALGIIDGIPSGGVLYSESISELEELLRLARLGLWAEKHGIDALTWIMPKVHQSYHEGELAECFKATCMEYHKALAALPSKGDSK